MHSSLLFTSPDYSHPSPKPAAPRMKPSTPPNFTPPLACAAAPVNSGAELVLGGGAVSVPVPVVVLDGAVDCFVVIFDDALAGTLLPCTLDAGADDA